MSLKVLLLLRRKYEEKKHAHMNLCYDYSLHLGLKHNSEASLTKKDQHHVRLCLKMWLRIGLTLSV